MATKKKTAAAAADTQTESAAAAAPMTPAAALTGSGVASPETTTAAVSDSGVARVRVRFLKRCESAELRCVFRPGAQATMPLTKAQKFADAGFVSILCPVI